MSPLTPQNLVELFDKPALFIDASYNIVAHNRRYQDKFSVPAEGARCFEHSHRYQAPCDRQGQQCPIQQALERKAPASALHIHFHDNKKHYCQVQITPVYTDQQELMGFIEILQQSQSASPEPSQVSLIGKSSAFKAMMESLHRVAPTDVSVLLEGESGTGKELVARALHEESLRANNRFVVLECSGMNENLFESELFGYRQGAFTGAKKDHEGLAATASGGTLFLDEVGDIPPSLQVKLLRLLESGTFRPVGSNDMKTTDFRLICASHKNLKQMVADGLFREDLYFRLATFPIHLPPLRNRISDLPLLCETLLSRPPVPDQTHVSNAALKQLGQYHFPGNIRELKNILIRAALLTDNGVIQTKHLPAEIGQQNSCDPGVQFGDQVQPLELIEEQYLRHVRQHFDGSATELAQRLGISERTLYRKLSRLDK